MIRLGTVRVCKRREFGLCLGRSSLGLRWEANERNRSVGRSTLFCIMLDKMTKHYGDKTNRNTFK